MNDLTEDINKKTSILLSRNRPIALVVGAAGFLGSHLVDKLLDKGIQVLGVDDLGNGGKQNLRKAAENRNFHLLIESPEKLDLDLPRLDYIFIMPGEKWDPDKVLDLFKTARARCLLVSSIELYEKDNSDKDLRWLKNIESKIARFAAEHNLNARILRLGPVYGPRMDFQTKDPLIKLIQQSLTADLQKQISLEFSSRAIYVSDAVDLAIRTIFAGSTAQKIFDGVLPTPVKVSEVKQVLLDPVWYETKDFRPSELPPWPTPNLDKTVKTLSWHPKTNLVAGLKETLSYFKDNEIFVPKLDDGGLKTEDGKELHKWSEEKKEDLQALKQKPDEPKEKPKKKIGLPRFLQPAKIYWMALLILITYALIWPTLTLGWGIFTFQSQLNESFKNLQIGEFDKSLVNISQSEVEVARAKSIFDSLDPIRKANLFKREFESIDQFFHLSMLSVNFAKETVLGTQSILQGLKAVTGELAQSPAGYFETAEVELTAASEDLAKANAILKRADFRKGLFGVFSKIANNLSGKLSLYESLANKAQGLSVLLPKLVALEGSPSGGAGSKTYLVLLQNNMELRPAGGFIGSFAKVSFEGGKLKTLDVNDIYAIDGALSIHVEPPKEIKEDLGQKDWFLRDSNWEADFPTSARQAEWFYTKEIGERVDGVVALDVSAIEELLRVVGSLDLPDYNEKITSDNLFEKAISHAEVSFFPGSQAKKSFITALTHQLFNKIFFLPQNNWPGVISALGRSLEEKHVSVYLNDPKLFSYLISQNWAHVLPRQSDQNRNQDFLSLIEANLGANKANYYLERSYNLETVVGKDGEIKHRLRISYINRSPSDAFPGGKYKNRMRIYLPFGSKLTRVLWGESDITKDVTSFVDYGRSGLSLLLELLPKEQKTLVLDWSVPIKLGFEDNMAEYRLDIIKQAGTLKDPLEWTITYPINYQLVSDQAKKIGPQEQTISTDLSKDRSFLVEFKK